MQPNRTSSGVPKNAIVVSLELQRFRLGAVPRTTAFPVVWRNWTTTIHNQDVGSPQWNFGIALGGIYERYAMRIRGKLTMWKCTVICVCSGNEEIESSIGGACCIGRTCIHTRMVSIKHQTQKCTCCFFVIFDVRVPFWNDSLSIR